MKVATLFFRQTHSMKLGMRGFSTPPENKTPNKLEKFAQQKAINFQKNLKRDLERSNVWDLKQALMQKGKPFEPQSYFGNDMKLVPNKLMNGKNLMKKDVSLREKFAKKPVSLFIVSQKRVTCRESIKKWRSAFKSNFPDYQIIEAVIPNFPSYNFFQPLWKFLMRFEGITEKDKELIIYTNKIKEMEPEEIGIEINNPYLPYIFLVDIRSRIRWRAVGKPSTKDVRDLKSAVNKIIKPETKDTKYETDMQESIE